MVVELGRREEKERAVVLGEKKRERGRGEKEGIYREGMTTRRGSNTFLSDDTFEKL